MREKVSRRVAFRIISTNIFLFLLLFSLVWINKNFFRPISRDFSFPTIVTGSFPNFIAGYLICLCVVNPVIVRQIKFGRQIVYIASFLIVFILSFEEFKPLWGASTQFDWYDIMGSVLGGFFALLTYEILKKKKEKIAYYQFVKKR